MNRRVPLVAAFASALLACSSSSPAPAPRTATIVVTAAKSTVLANGSNTVAIHYEGAATAPVTIQTQRGMFGSTSAVQMETTSGDALLVTCDATTDTACAGNDTIIVTDASLNVGRVTVRFLGLDGCVTDCGFDAACVNRTCTTTSGATGSCSATAPSACVVPVCSGAQTAETLCSDGLDNDCNGLIDCADSACDGQPCKAGASDWSCQRGACTQATPTTGVTYGLQVSPSRTRIPAGGAVEAVKITVTAGSSPAGNVPVTVSVSAGSGVSATQGGTPAQQASAVTASDGTATVWLTGPAKPGLVKITAALTSNPTVSLDAYVTVPAIGSLVLGAKTYAVMGVRTSGYQETNPISVQVLDDQGAPYPDGLPVSFQHQQLGGSSLTPGAASNTCTTAAGVSSCVAPTASPVAVAAADTTGLATVTLNPGIMSGTLVVTASATVDGVTRTFTFPGFPVIGAKASASNFSIVCAPLNIPALADTNCHTSNVDTEFTCKAILKDRFGNLVGVPTPVTFRAEAGAIGPATALTPAFDPTQDPTAQGTLGSAVQIFHTLGAPLPKDVSPVAGEPRTTWTYDPCDPTPATPTRVHNPRDGVVTIIAVADGEDAFTDLNGNGQYDRGEPYITQGLPFIDANDDGVRNADEWFEDVNGDGQYLGPSATTAWRSSTKIWTQTVVVFTGIPDTLPGAAPGTLLGTRIVKALDPDACVATPAGTSFSVKASKEGSPPVPPTTDYFLLFASDGNLNRLTTATTYGVSVVAPGTVTTTYGGLASYADQLGFFYRYWPCDKDGGNCANQCAATGAGLPCMMQPSVFGYSCGISTYGSVTGGAKAEVAEVAWKVAMPYPYYSGTVTVLSGGRLPGTVTLP